MSVDILMHGFFFEDSLGKHGV